MVILPVMAVTSCTDLSEQAYDRIDRTNVIQTAEDIRAVAMSPFGHAFWSVTRLPRLQENTADHWVTYTRCGSLWYEGGLFVRFHRHDWTQDDNDIHSAWNSFWIGISQINEALDLLEEVNPEAYGMTQDEYNTLIAGDKALRARYYIMLFDMFRNLPIHTSLIHTERNVETQVSPDRMFEFIEGELLALLDNPYVPVKQSLGGNGTKTMQWNKAGIASLLVRIYLNSEKWTGTARYDKCAEYAQKIIDGEYGPYRFSDKWDAVFDWDNDTSDEVIYAFESSLEHTHSHYMDMTYWWALCGDVNSKYFLSTVDGDPNMQYALAPGLDNDGNELSYDLGKPVRKFQKYPNDVRLKLYKNLPTGGREGMFLFGNIPNLKEGGNLRQGYGTSSESPLYIRDQAGFFYSETGISIDDKRSGVEYADMNSGWRQVKYPFYGDDFKDRRYASDFAEIRLAEIYYSLAECKLRAGDAAAAADLVNEVRSRYYPEEDWADYLYKGTKAPQGNVELTMNEMLDEWGREFLGEFRRRTDLCRFGRFDEAWWDKPSKGSDIYDIFPISRTALNGNPLLKQNPGY